MLKYQIISTIYRIKEYIISSLLTTKNNTVSKNATTHGIYSSDVALKWEDQSAFDALHQALREEYDPQWASEEGAVFELASLHWKQRRFDLSPGISSKNG